MRLAVATLFCALCIALGGCTKMSMLMVLNTSGREVRVAMVSSEEESGDPGPWSSGEWTIPNDKWEETLYWSRRPPDWIRATVSSTSDPKQERWEFADYPKEMQECSGVFDFYIVELKSDSMVLRKPTLRERWDYNPAGNLFLLLCPVSVGLGLWLAIRHARKAEWI